MILDLLHLIQSDLLRMTSCKRARCDQIVEELQRIHRRCESDPIYCTQRTFGVIRKTPTDLSDTVVVNVSPEMEDEVIKNIPPKDVGQPNERLAASLQDEKECKDTEQPPEHIYSPLHVQVSTEKQILPSQEALPPTVASQDRLKDEASATRVIRKKRDRMRGILISLAGCFSQRR